MIFLPEQIESTQPPSLSSNYVRNCIFSSSYYSERDNELRHDESRPELALISPTLTKATQVVIVSRRLIRFTLGRLFSEDGNSVSIT